MTRSSAHEQFDRLETPAALSDRAFGLAVSVVLAVHACAPLPRGGAVRGWSLGASAALVAMALLHASLLHPAAWVWMKVTRTVGRGIGQIAMAALFYLVITPTGLVRRCFVRDPLRLEIDPGAASYWIERTPPGPAPESLANPF